jgi:hypothetical protein
MAFPPGYEGVPCARQRLQSLLSTFTLLQYGFLILRFWAEQRGPLESKGEVSGHDC